MEKNGKKSEGSDEGEMESKKKTGERSELRLGIRKEGTE